MKAADGVLDDIEDTLKHLSQYPKLGRSRPELKKDLWSIVAADHYVVFYIERGASIEVIRVISAQRDVTLEFRI